MRALPLGVRDQGLIQLVRRWLVRSISIGVLLISLDHWARRALDGRSAAPLFGAKSRTAWAVSTRAARVIFRNEVVLPENCDANAYCQMSCVLCPATHPLASAKVFRSLEGRSTSAR
jgi:hypothetical protein